MHGLVAVCLLTACWSAPVVVRVPQPPPIAAPLPSCPMRLDGVHLVVNEVDLGEFADGVDPDLAIYQTGAHAFVSFRRHDNERDRGPQGGESLWEVACTGTKIGVITQPGANFGHAALHADRRRLFYTGLLGVTTLDLVTRTHTQLTKGETIKQCWENGERHLVDVVQRVTTDHVEFRRGGPCGFESDYTSTLMRRHLATGAEEVARPVSSVAMVGEAIWLVSRGEIYRSTDWRTWTKVPGVHAALSLIVDRETIIASSNPGDFGDGDAPIMLTTNTGRSWKEIGRGMWIKGTGLHDLVVRSGGALMHWENGALVELDGPDQAPPVTRTEVTIGTRVVRLTAFGLIDVRSGERLFPR